MLALVAARTSSADAGDPPSFRAVVVPQPLRFEENLGQWEPDVRFLCRARGYTLYLTRSELIVALHARAPSSPRMSPFREGHLEAAAVHLVRMKFSNAQPGVELVGREELPGRSNYFLGSDASKWRTGVRAFATVEYLGLYHGIDLILGERAGDLEYRFRVAPDADPGVIALNVVGPDSSRVAENGDLLMAVPGGVLRHSKPTTVSLVGGAACSEFRIEGDSVRLGVARDTPSSELLIDPTLTYSTFLGGSDDDSAWGVAVDSAGDIYVSGGTTSTNFPVVGPYQGSISGVLDAFVSKFRSDGAALIYSTYLGGSDIEDPIAGMALDSLGRVAITGGTESTDFPLMNPLQGALASPFESDAFLSVLDPTGSALVFSTYLGGAGVDRGNAVAFDPAGALLVAGDTQSSDFPVVNAMKPTMTGPGDGFVAKVDVGTPALVYSTFLGGSDGDVVFAMAIDAAGGTYLTGRTTSADFPVTSTAIQPAFGGGPSPPPWDAFVTQLTPAGNAITYSSYLGGASFDSGDGIALDPSDAIYVVTTTSSDNFPIYRALQPVYGGNNDITVTKLAPGGSSLVYSTYLGGPTWNTADAVTADTAGHAYIVGFSDPPFPLSSPTQPNPGGGGDAIVAKLAPDGSRLVYSTYLGGNDMDWATRIVLDPSRGTVVVGVTFSGNFPTVTPFQPNHGGGFIDAFLARISGPAAGFTGAPLAGIAPLSVQFSDLSSGSITAWQWSFGDGGTSTAQSPNHAYASPGSYDVTLTVTGPDGSGTERKVGYVVVSEVVADFTADPRLGQPPLAVQFTDQSVGSVQGWLWDFGDGGTSTAASPAHTYAASGRYDVALTVMGPSTQDTETKAEYVVVSPSRPVGIATGPGPDPGAAPRVLAFDVLGRQNPSTDIIPYAVLKYGVNVGAGNVDGMGVADILTGPGPGAIFGPQVRAFQVSSAPIPKVNFYAYGTLRYGAAAMGAALDGDAADEILSTPGPGAVFGPHVRGWNFDGVGLTALPGLSFYAYATLKYGVNAGRGDIASAGPDEILTMPGPGPTFGAQSRGFRYGPPITALAKVNFYAFAGARYGGRIDGSDVDGDGWEEILACQGPAASYTPQTRGFDYDDSSVVATAGLDFTPFPGQYGGEPHGGDLDGDGAGDILVSRGPDPYGDSRARGFRYAGAAVVSITGVDVTPYPSTYGMHVSGADFGF